MGGCLQGGWPSIFCSGRNSHQDKASVLGGGRLDGYSVQKMKAPLKAEALAANPL